MTLVVPFVRPVLFSFWGLKIQTFGFFMFLAFAAAYRILLLKTRGLGIDPADLIVCAILGGVFGAKLHCVFSSDFQVFFSPTGFYFQGGVVGGAFLVCLFLKWKNKSLAKWADLILPLIPMGHGIGKLGCFFSGDGCYGTPSDLPWAMSFPNGLVPTRRAVHPTPLYECLVEMGLWWLVSRDRFEGRQGMRTSLVLMGMGVIRFVLETWRAHEVVAFGLTEFQILALVTCVAGAWFYPRSTNLKKKV